MEVLVVKYELGMVEVEVLVVKCELGVEVEVLVVKWEKVQVLKDVLEATPVYF